ncbi:MAG: hypothetical protein R3C27_12165 [Hyphomonadaceae bacterium]
MAQRDQQRLLDDPVLSDPITDDERAIVSALFERHEVEQIAAAFARLYRKGQPAPEELIAPPTHAQAATPQRHGQAQSGGSHYCRSRAES